MRASMAAMAALAGGLFFLPAVQGPASATSVPINLKNVLGSGMLFVFALPEATKTSGQQSVGQAQPGQPR